MGRMGSLLILPILPILLSSIRSYSTVTDLARLRGWSTSQSRRRATW
jgi:hypothetical protein